MKRRFAALAGLLALSAAPATMADRVPQVHAITGVRIVIGPGKVIESGTLVVRDGLIEAVGADVPVPADARVHQLEKTTVYPGLIEIYHPVDWPAAAEKDEPSKAAHPNALIRPERDATDVAFADAELTKLREAGFTTALMAPKKGILRGQSVLLELGGGSLADNLLRRHVAQHGALEISGGRGEGYPASTMGALALFRQTLEDAKWQQDALAAFAKKPTQRRPPYSPVLESLGPLFRTKDKQRIFLESKDVLDTLRLARLAREFQLDAVLIGSGEEYKRLDAVVATGYPQIVPVDFPKAPQIGEKDDLQVELATLRHWNEAPANPKKLLDAKVPFAFTSNGLSEPKKLHEMMAQALERGLTADEALAAFTTIPAQMLGIADRVGTLEAGKAANLILASGDLFTKETKIKAVFVDGIRFEVKESKAATVEPAGEWSLLVDAGGQTIPLTLKLEGKADALTGQVLGPAGAIPLSSVDVSGDTVEMSFDAGRMGMPGTITFTLTISGNSATGSGTSPRGNFTLKGDRTSGPPSSPEVAR